MANELLKTLTIDGVAMDIDSGRLPKNYTHASYPGTVIPTGVNTLKDLFTAPSAGLVIGTAYIQWTANTKGIRWLEIYKNGSGMGFAQKSPPTNNAVLGQSVTVVDRVNTNDNLRLAAFQNSGGNITATYWVGRVLFIPDEA